MTTHTLRTTIRTPGKPAAYKAACDYISHDPAEFIDPTSRRKTEVNCPQCIAKKTCRKCGAERYTDGSGYKYQLCEKHLKENLEAFNNG
jgi:hypothetical protein